ncbi:tudor domain-containing protein 3-like [Xenia sp. Carnegie-2017]|uniref:tudor domain-containing protein 3-like n=1 Tax=Xenia sp. Carnegie-2017 TaxID=2897299 RepID=UPI001F040A18|nr:tudor domain-containing protein 3-like [Xenia sp. Carnegie-2017]
MADKTVKIKHFDEKLKSRGWNLSLDAINEFLQQLELSKREHSVENVCKLAINCNLKEIGTKRLSEYVKRGQVQSVEGPFVLQIQKIRNISAPKANEESSIAPRLLKLQLTDGHTTCFALEHSHIQKLSLSTLPGTKIRLKGVIPLICGFMLLESCHVDILGGRVEHLVLKWEANKSASQQRVQGLPRDEGPPLFTRFDPKTNGMSTSKIVWKASARENIASKETEVDEDDGKTENKAFKESRDQRIQSASDHNKVSKPTTSGSTNLKNSSEGSSCAHPSSSGRIDHDNIEWQANEGRHGQKTSVEPQSKSRNTLFQKKDGQKVQENFNSKKKEVRSKERHHEKFSDEQHISRPSEGTLWDFLETKLPPKNCVSETADGKTENSGTYKSESRKNETQRNVDCNKHNNLAALGNRQEQAVIVGDSTEKRNKSRQNDNYRSKEKNPRRSNIEHNFNESDNRSKARSCKVNDRNRNSSITDGLSSRNHCKYRPSEREPAVTNAKGNGGSHKEQHKESKCDLKANYEKKKYPQLLNPDGKREINSKNRCHDMDIKDMNMNKNLEYSKNISSRKYDQFATKNQSKNSNGKQRSFDSEAEETGRVEICKSKSEDRSQKETGERLVEISQRRQNSMSVNKAVVGNLVMTVKLLFQITSIGGQKAKIVWQFMPNTASTTLRG